MRKLGADITPKDLQLKIVFAAVAVSAWIRLGVSDGLSKSGGGSKWICECAYPFDGNPNFVNFNCSRSCSCFPGVRNESRWTCLCSGDDGLPQVAADPHRSSCFSSCNCSSGTPSIAPSPSSSRNSSRLAAIVVSSILAFTTLACLASLALHNCRRDLCGGQDGGEKRNAASDLVSSTVSADLSYNRIPGCFDKAFFFRTKTEIIHGPLARFLFSELELATERFSDENLIGIGGSSRVYRGQLKNGKVVAVKRLKQRREADGDHLFHTEVEVLSRLHHCHVVPLLGYCSESQGRQSERLLVFEYMPNGNLRDSLDRRRGEILSWESRITIAFGAARGLEYLHEAAAPRILHRDVKSTNVLLGDSWKAKITDLGLAKRLTADESCSCSSSPARIEGTFGYLAPEYAMVGRPSLMSDVFSFGVVLLELITGRHPIHRVPGKGEESLVLWATPRLQNSQSVIEELPDPRLKGNFHEEEMQIMAYIAKECLLLNPDARPNMSEVVQMLSSIAPDKSRRRSIPAYVIQGSSPFSKSTESPAFRFAETSPWSSKVGCLNNMSGVEEDNGVSSECMERLLLLSSSSCALAADEEEAVDLTEPRFESFCMTSIKCQ